MASSSGGGGLPQMKGPVQYRPKQQNLVLGKPGDDTTWADVVYKDSMWIKFEKPLQDRDRLDGIFSILQKEILTCQEQYDKIKSLSPMGNGRWLVRFEDNASLTGIEAGEKLSAKYKVKYSYGVGEVEVKPKRITPSGPAYLYKTLRVHGVPVIIDPDSVADEIVSMTCGIESVVGKLYECYKEPEFAKVRNGVIRIKIRMVRENENTVRQNVLGQKTIRGVPVRITMAGDRPACFICNSTEHQKKDCPDYDKYCFKCSGRGHLPAQCNMAYLLKNKKEYTNEDEVPEGQDESKSISNKQTQNNEKEQEPLQEQLGSIAPTVAKTVPNLSHTEQDDNTDEMDTADGANGQYNNDNILESKSDEQLDAKDDEPAANFSIASSEEEDGSTSEDEVNSISKVVSGDKSKRQLETSTNSEPSPMLNRNKTEKSKKKESKKMKQNEEKGISLQMVDASVSTTSVLNS